MRFQRIVPCSYLLLLLHAATISSAKQFPLRKLSLVQQQPNSNSGSCMTRRTCDIRGGSSTAASAAASVDDGDDELTDTKTEADAATKDLKQKNPRRSFFGGSESGSGSGRKRRRESDPSQDEGENENENGKQEEGDDEEESTMDAAPTPEMKFGFFNRRSTTPPQKSKVNENDDSEDEDGAQGQEKDEISPAAAEKVETSKLGFFGRRSKVEVGGGETGETTTTTTNVIEEEEGTQMDDDDVGTVENVDDDDGNNNNDNSSSDTTKEIVGKRFGFFGRRGQVQSSVEIEAKINDEATGTVTSVDGLEEQGENGQEGERIITDGTNVDTEMDDTETAADDAVEELVDGDAGSEVADSGTEPIEIMEEPKAGNKFGFFRRQKKIQEKVEEVNGDTGADAEMGDMESVTDAAEEEVVDDEGGSDVADSGTEPIEITEEPKSGNKFGFFRRQKQLEEKVEEVNGDTGADAEMGDMESVTDAAEEEVVDDEGGSDVADSGTEPIEITEEPKAGNKFGFFRRQKKLEEEKVEDFTTKPDANKLPINSQTPDNSPMSELIVEEDVKADDEEIETVDTIIKNKEEEEKQLEESVETTTKDENQGDTTSSSEVDKNPAENNVQDASDEVQNEEKEGEVSFVEYLGSTEESTDVGEKVMSNKDQAHPTRRFFFSFGKKQKSTSPSSETSKHEEIKSDERDTDKSTSDNDVSGDADDTDIQQSIPSNKEDDQAISGNSTVPTGDDDKTVRESPDANDGMEAAIQILINEVIKSQGAEEADKSSKTVSQDPSIKGKTDEGEGEESNDSTADKEESPAEPPQKKSSKKKKRVKGHFGPSRALQNAFPWLKEEDSEDKKEDLPQEEQPSVDPRASPNPQQQQAVPAVGGPFSPFGQPTGPIILTAPPTFGRQRYPPGMPPPPSSRTDATIANLVASLLPLLSRLAILTLLSSSALFGHSEVYSPKPSQHFMLERMNDRYERDGLAMKRALEHPPHKKQKGLWTIVMNGRKGALKKHFAKTEKHDDKANANKAIDLYTRTVIVMDVQTMKSDIENVVEELRDAVSFILRQYNDRTTRLDMGTDLEIVVCVESPGGVVQDFGLAADQLARLREAGKERNDLSLTVCVDKVAASGGYLMACQANPGQLFAAPYAVIGSIGVLRETINVHDVLEKYGIRPLLLKAGYAKAPLTMTNEVTEENLGFVQKNLEKVHDAFRDTVSTARGDTISDNYDEVTSGDIFLGKDAADYGLVDCLKTSDEYIYERIQAGDRVLRLHKYDKSRMSLHFSPLDLLLLKNDGPFGKHLGKIVHKLIRIGSQVIKVGGMVGAIKILDENYQATNRRRLQDDI